MPVTEKQLIDDINAQKFAPVYLLTGEENYYIDEISNYFETHVVAEELRDFDQTVIYGRDVAEDMARVIDTALRFPMMSPYQLVLVKEAQDIRTEQWETLVNYLNAPSPSTVLVFCYRHKKMDKRSKVYKAINSKGVVYEKNKLYDSQIPDWIAHTVAKNKYQITEKGAILIAESLGNDLGKIVNELQKVFVTLPEGSVITEEVIEENIGISKDYNVFELQNALGRRNVARCNRIVNYFASNPKSNPIQMILPNLYSYFIKVMLYHQVTDKSQAPSVLKVSPFFVREYEVASRNYTLGKLASCIGYLYDADLRSKGVRNTGTVTDGELLKELVFKILH
ncbi:MAG: DNA polymerase III subunit delta [Bacteroidales bacterium]|nr:DNA polymerase III subunit delta [Bacteroidales bacterium]